MIWIMQTQIKDNCSLGYSFVVRHPHTQKAMIRELPSMGGNFFLEQESESDYNASNDKTDSKMVFEIDINDMTD